MADESELRARVAAAGRAQAELGSFERAFIDVRAVYFDAWKRSGAPDVDQRERLWIACSVVNLVEEQLRRIEQGGKVAQSDLDRITKLAAE